jgi:hypothetical protein
MTMGGLSSRRSVQRPDRVSDDVAINAAPREPASTLHGGTPSSSSCEVASTDLQSATLAAVIDICSVSVRLSAPLSLASELCQYLVNRRDSGDCSLPLQFAVCVQNRINFAPEKQVRSRTDIGGTRIHATWYKHVKLIACLIRFSH